MSSKQLGVKRASAAFTLQIHPLAEESGLKSVVGSLLGYVSISIAHLETEIHLKSEPICLCKVVHGQIGWGASVKIIFEKLPRMLIWI